MPFGGELTVELRAPFLRVPYFRASAPLEKKTCPWFVLVNRSILLSRFRNSENDKGNIERLTVYKDVLNDQ